MNFSENIDAIVLSCPLQRWEQVFYQIAQLGLIECECVVNITRDTQMILLQSLLVPNDLPTQIF